MNIREIYLGRARRLEIQGDINKQDLHKLHAQLEAAAEATAVEIDLMGVLFAGSDFLNFLVDIKNRHPEAARKVTLHNPNEVIAELLAMTQLDKVFTVRYDSVVNAVM